MTQRAGAATDGVSNVFVDDIDLMMDENVFVGLFEHGSHPGSNLDPYPANDRINITAYAMHGAAVLTITNRAGRIVELHCVCEVVRSIFNISYVGLPNGVYMVNEGPSGVGRQQCEVVTH